MSSTQPHHETSDSHSGATDDVNLVAPPPSMVDGAIQIHLGDATEPGVIPDASVSVKENEDVPLFSFLTGMKDDIAARWPYYWDD